MTDILTIKIAIGVAGGLYLAIMCVMLVQLWDARTKARRAHEAMIQAHLASIQGLLAESQAAWERIRADRSPS